MDLGRPDVTNHLWALIILGISFADTVLSEGRGDLIYGQWTFRVHKKALSWSQAATKCSRSEGKLLEPSGAYGHAVTSLLMLHKPPDYKVWIGAWHNKTSWNFSDATISEIYNETEAAWHPSGRSMLGINDSKVARAASAGVMGSQGGGGHHPPGSEGGGGTEYFRSACTLISATANEDKEISKNERGWHMKPCNEQHSFICEFTDSECDRRSDVTYSAEGKARCFRFVLDELNWYQARRYCKQNGSRLAIVESRDLHTHLTKNIEENARNIPQFSSRHWMGLSQIFWRWQNGYPVEEELWADGTPNRHGGACVALANNASLVWHNLPCDTSLPSICVSKTKIQKDGDKIYPMDMPNTRLKSDDDYQDELDECRCMNASRIFDIHYLWSIWKDITLYGLLMNASYIAIGFGGGAIITTMIAIPCCCCCRRQRKPLERSKDPYASVWNNPACLSITEETAQVDRPRYQGQPRPGMEGAGGYSAPLPSAPYEHTYESPYAYIPGANDMPRN